MDLFRGLNPAQALAVRHVDGPLVVFAGAGSGKTRVITSRIAHLIDQGVAPGQILAVTFTNKAAKEMHHRAEGLNPLSRATLITTFHSAAARWLRAFAPRLGFTSSFSIYDDQEATSVLKKVLAAHHDKAAIASASAQMKRFLHLVKTKGLRPHEVDEEEYRRRRLLPPAAIAVYKAYQDALKLANAMDFNDLLIHLLVLLREHREVRLQLQEQYNYILVDEFQDTNPTQFEILRILAERHQNLCVVGDDDQSIYSWRGGTAGHILEFDRQFPKAKIIKLEQNYRCSANVVEAANALIQKNLNRAPKRLFSEAPAGDLIDLQIEADSTLEAWYVADTVAREAKEFPFQDVAIFYRTNAQSRLLEEHLRRKQVPFRIFGSLEFFERAEVKDLLAYLKLYSNEADDVSLRRILNVPTRGIGDSTLQLLERRQIATNCCLLEVIKNTVSSGDHKLQVKLNKFLQPYLQIRQRLEDEPARLAIKIVLESTNYYDYLRAKYPDQYEDKCENIEELQSALNEAVEREPDLSIQDWLQSLALVREDDDAAYADQGYVSLMTLHLAKGLEYPRVFVVGIEENILPHSNSLGSEELIEEERRLLYVGMTRAKKKLTLTAAKRRQVYNETTANALSRFLGEIPTEYFASRAKQKPKSTFREDLDQGLTYEYDLEVELEHLRKGARVAHPTYGIGTVVTVEEVFQKTQVLVNFPDVGLRRIRPSQLFKA